MSLDYDLAHDYLASLTPWLWDWQEGGEVVTWANGATIAFRSEIGLLLSRLEPLGLPRFGAIVLLAGAYRDSWPTPSSGRGALEEFLSKFHSPTESYLLFTDVLEGLDRVHELRDLLTTPAAKAELAALIFESARYRWPEKPTATVVRAFHTGLPPGTFESASSEPVESILADIADLRPGLAKLDRNSLASCLKTGLEQEVEPAPVSLPPGVAARELIKQLADDEELGGVARLARLLLAAVQLPRPLFDPEELPVGGVTDITNRGPLDRLMLSELAHDDLTLAVRVAMNEALYLRREPLPRALSRQRFVLIDSGLRLWGVPRVFATAIGLAVAAQADRHVEVQQWRAHGDRIVPIDFTTAQGLANHLAVLDHHVHPAESLPAFEEAIQSATLASDALLITSDEVLADREFSRHLAELNVDSLHIAAVDRRGSFRLLHRTKRGMKLLRQATFALDEVLAPRARPTTPLIDSRRETVMPAIYGVQPFPLRVSATVRPANSWHDVAAGKVLTLTNDGRLLQWDAPTLGAREISSGLPSGQLQWCSSLASNHISLVVGKLSRRGLYSVDLNMDTGRQTVHRLQLSADQPGVITVHQGVILVLYAKHVDALDPSTGSLLDTRENPHPIPRPCGIPRWNRFFPLQYLGHLGSMRWGAISFDGTAIQFSELARAKPGSAPLLAVFDRPNSREGPVGVTATAELIHLNDERREPISFHWNRVPCAIRAVSKDGLRVLFGESKRFGTVRTVLPDQLLLDLGTYSGTTVLGEPNAIVECLGTVAKPRNLRRRFHGITLDREGNLTLVSRKGSLFLIRLTPQGNLIWIPRVPAVPRALGTVQRFETVDEHSVGGRNMSIARWQDGSTAVLDRLGMLHLRSSDRTIPECTIVLCDGPTSGWLSDGRFWGEPYFVDNNTTTPEKVVWEEVLRPFVQQLR